MNLYTLLALCASAISISLGVSVYLLNRKASINKFFMLTMAANAYWSFCEFMIYQSPSVEVAAWWGKALSFWPFLVVLMLHFTLAFTESDLLKNKLSYVVLYFPALFFSLVDLSTDWISGAPGITPWGYQTTISPTIVARLDGVWAAVLGLLVLFFYATYYKRILDATRKQQTKLMAVGFGVPIVISIFTDSIFQVMNIEFPVLGCISGSITAFFILYAISEYGLFSFRPEIAAENIFSTMPDSVILVNLRGVIVKVNRALMELTGYGEVELLGKSISETVLKAQVLGKGNSTPHIMAQLGKARELKNVEITFEVKSGERKTGSLSCSMVTDNNGRDVGAAFVLHDISARKEMEQKLLKAERLASIGELAGLLGHDLRNPLSGIRGATFYLKRKYANVLDNEDQAMFDGIDKSINYSNKIINDLIDYSSEINLDLKLATPKGLVNGALALLAPPSHVEVVDQTVDVPEFLVDEGKVCRGFMNIVKNAFDAMPNGGKLLITNEQVGERVVFCFRDWGQGMTEETLSKLWTPLFTTKAKGMGFGLAICKRTVEAHGGKIFAESILEGGTTVKVELPLNLKC